MKKLGKFLLVGAMAAIATVGLVACGNSGYEGEYKYRNPYDKDGAETYYGAKVSVEITDVKTDVEVDGKTYSVIKDGRISKITIEADTDTYFNVSAGWADKDKASPEKVEEYLKKFEGKKIVEDLMSAGNVEVSDKGVPTSITGYETITGATQTSGRIILAVQDAIYRVTEDGKIDENCWYYHMMKYNADEMGVDLDEMLENM